MPLSCHKSWAHRIRRCLMLVLVLVLVASNLTQCSAPQEPSQLAVVGGRPLETNSPAYRSLVGLARPSKGGFETFCSGVLVSPELVLTAAHCLVGINALVPLSIVFDRAASPNPVQIRGTIATQTRTDDPDKYYPNFDVGWIRLSQKAPLGYEPAEILRDEKALEPLIGEEAGVLLAGYGKTSSQCDKDQPGCSGKALEVRSRLRRYVNTSHFRNLLLVGPNPGAGSCNGDSGGPLFGQLEGRWYLLGLLHGKSPVLNSSLVLDSQTACESGESVYTFLGAYTEWIEQSTAVRLPRDNSRNPQVNTQLPPVSLPESPRLADYIRFSDIESDLWYSVEVLLSGFRDPSKRIDPDFDLLVTDPERAAEAIENWESFTADGMGFTRLAGGPGSYDQQISDLTPFRHLKRLKRLDLIGQRIRSTEVLGELTQLEELTLSNNFDLKTQTRIPWDLQFLKRLPKLKVLNLFTNGESLDLRQVPWGSLDGLESLILSNNAGVLDLTAIPWDSLPRLKQLVIMNSELSDIRPLAEAKSLEQLNLRRNLIRDIAVLEQLPGLRIVDVSQNQIENFAPVQNLPRLESLYALDNPSQEAVCPKGAECIYNPEGLQSFAAYCAFAQGLSEEDRNLWSGTPTVIRALRETSQTELASANCDQASHELGARSGLNLSGLRSLISISDLNPLRPLRNLVQIDLDYNHISDITPLQELEYLRIINLTGNRVSSIAALAGLKNLQTLKLDSNLVEDLEQFRPFRETEISLLKNPIREKACPVAGGRCVFDDGVIYGPDR